MFIISPSLSLLVLTQGKAEFRKPRPMGSVRYVFEIYSHKEDDVELCILNPRPLRSQSLEQHSPTITMA